MKINTYLHNMLCHVVVIALKRNKAGRSTAQESTNTSCKAPNNKYFRLRGPHDLSQLLNSALVA